MKIGKAFVMSVHAGAEREYENRHNPIWPELEKARQDPSVVLIGWWMGKKCAR